MADATRRIVLELLAKNKGTAEMLAFGRDMARVEKTIVSIGRTAMNVFGISGGIYGVKQFLTSTTKEAVDFEYQMARVNTMLDEGSAKHLPRFGNEIERMSVQYGKAVADLTAGAYDILSSSIAPSKAMQVLEANIRAAKGGFTDTSVAVKASVGLLNAYGLQAEKIDYVTNIMAKTVKSGVITFEELAQNIGTVSSLAAVLGVDLEAVGASISTMTRAGISPEITMTALRAILNTFKNPTEEAAKAAKELGFALDETSIKGGGMIEVMQRLSKADAQQLDALMPNVRGLVGFAAGLKNATALGDDYAYMLSNVNMIEDAFAKAEATTQSQLERTTQLWAAAKREIGEGFIPVVSDLTKVVNDNASALRRYLQDFREGVEIALEIQKTMRQLAKPPWLQAYEAIKGRKEQVPSEPRITDPAAYQRFLDLPHKQAIETLQNFQGPLPGTEGGMIIERINKRLTESSIKATMDIAAAYARMYSDIDSKSAASFEARERLIQEEYKVYDQTIKDKYALDMWFLDQQRKLAEQEALARGGPLEGIAVAIAEMKRDLPSVGKLFYDMTKTGVDGLVNSLGDAVFEARDFKDAMEEVGRSMARMAFEWAARTAIVNSLAGGMGLLGFKMPASAKGNVFGSQGIVPFAKGDIITRPTIFPFARGIGLAGEEGEEGLLPLDRDSSGRLSVHATGSSSNNQRIEALLGQVVTLLSQRQQITLSARVVDHRDVVTKERMEGKEGEKYVMYHSSRNSG